ncbi:DUF3429 domain-containing protein [Chenggangzhangella methanolivorans]|uniref:DUF3429 domain-containing protein n=1 Tax=Chenggangzhangella methanolivorans TaxID=1437009 RepID=A0A9E6RDN5_9HYPH|nr:DUF3429 domain-containing protein [Chenggangzhangella methanolivorans]QZO01423.1 DUF3429 domain-containing protein [Chenggangzhangella methanolivorans]
MTLIASEPVRDDHEIPPIPLAVGLAGLAPFIGLALTVALAGGETGASASVALLAYAALILSFFGGAHWGLALRHPARELRAGLYLGAAISPAWALAGVLLGGAGGLGLVAAGLVAQGAVDGLKSTRFAAPRWYPRLRALLAALASVATAAAAVVVASQQV